MASCHVFKKRGAGLACTPHPPTETREALDAAGGCLRPRRAYKLRGSATQLHSRSEEDWSIRSKRWQDKLLCYRVVYKRILSNFPRPQEQLRIHLEDLYIYKLLLELSCSHGHKIDESKRWGFGVRGCIHDTYTNSWCSMQISVQGFHWPNYVKKVTNMCWNDFS